MFSSVASRVVRQPTRRIHRMRTFLFLLERYADRAQRSKYASRSVVRYLENERSMPHSG
jgi:hypothetical protein